MTTKTDEQMTLDYYMEDEETRTTLIMIRLQLDLEKTSEGKIKVKQWCRENKYSYQDCKKASRKGHKEGRFTLTWGVKGYYIYRKDKKKTGILDTQPPRYSAHKIYQEIKDIIEEEKNRTRKRKNKP